MPLDRTLPYGGVIVLALAVMVGACAWTPRVTHYPSGMTIIRTDQRTLDTVCSHVDDKGVPVGPDRHAQGCYSKHDDTLYLLNNCEGAEAWTHELGHRDGVADPEAAGFNW